MKGLQRMAHDSTPDSKRLRVWQAVAMIPKGTVVGYGELAKLAGLAGAARFVGSVLRDLPQDSRLPWHRVLRADGRIAFADNSKAFHEQVARLRGEGIDVLNGRVDMRRYGYRQQQSF